MSNTEELGEPYLVVRNHEDQYALWLQDLEVPAGWSVVGEPGSREACLARVEHLWQDMRPRSLRPPREAL